jgi:hypothetical protein
MHPKKLSSGAEAPASQRKRSFGFPRSLFSRGNEILHDRFSHQVGRQQALRQNEVMEFPLIELWSQSRFGIFS